MHYIHRSSLLVLAYEKIQLDSNVCKWCFVLGWSSWAKAVCMSLYVCVIAKQTKNKNKTTLLDLYSLSIIILLCCYEYRTVPRTVQYAIPVARKRRRKVRSHEKRSLMMWSYCVYCIFIYCALPSRRTPSCWFNLILVQQTSKRLTLLSWAASISFFSFSTCSCVVLSTPRSGKTGSALF